MQSDLGDLIRIGKVSSIDEGTCTARIAFEDRSNSVSYDLPVIVPLTLNDKCYYMPQIEERVVCIFLPNAPTKGFILGSYHCSTRQPVYGNKNKMYIQFEDKTLVEYDKKEHKFKMHIIESSDTSLEIVSKGNVNIECNGSMNIKSDGPIVIESGTSLKMKAPVIDIN